MGDLECHRTSMTLRVRDPKVLIYKIKNILRMEEKMEEVEGREKQPPASPSGPKGWDPII